MIKLIITQNTHPQSKLKEKGEEAFAFASSPSEETGGTPLLGFNI